MPPTLRVATERVVSAAPERVAAFLADYRAKRRLILPPAFLDFAVEEGGQGAGTVIRYRLRAARRERAYRMRVEQPESRTLVERDTGSSLVTTWRVRPAGEARRAAVQLTSEWQGARGIGGFFERLFAPRGLRRIYDDVLGRLARAVEQEPA